MSNKLTFGVLAILTILAIVALCVQAFRDRRLLEQFPKLDGAIVRLVLIGTASSLLAWLLGYESRLCWFAFNACVLAGLLYANWVYFTLFFPLKLETKDGEVRLKIATTHYEELTPGVWVRQYPGGGSVVHSAEPELIAKAEELKKKYSASDWDCFLFDIGRDLPAPSGDDVPPDFMLHRYKKSRQVYFTTTGSAQIVPGMPDVTPSAPLMIPPNRWHHVKRRGHVIGGTLVERK